MLFSSLLSTMLLAASVISIPTQTLSSPTALDQDDERYFGNALNAIDHVQDPMKTLCKDGKASEAQSQFASLEPPVKQLSVHVHSVIQISQKISLNGGAFLQRFMQIITDFNVIITTVNGYVEVQESLSVQIQELNVYFKTITDDLSGAGLDVITSFQQTQIDFRIWIKLGLNFLCGYVDESPKRL
ncbi:hypothetical protein O181_042267 [Austropuccinia psidii MF-1]|uniref:Uncharacterized protein n=1 Tax=Austropuccinia psidii MF-1 TaxID=1389203 RepID=A0A9Q3DIA9_9BASI|nr:hypothetical protein [Austropuccinia psidii MF-1]